MKSNSPNILFMICHDLGQYLGCYGYEDARTPNIDRFAREGMQFWKSFCCAPQCSPSRAGLWTGRYPHANGVVGLAHYWFQNDLNPDEVHFSHMAAEAGYETVLFGIQHETPDPENRLGYDQIHPTKPAQEMANSVAEFLGARSENAPPFFLNIGTFEPHRPFPHEGVDPLPPEDMLIPAPLPDIPEVRESLSDFEASTVTVDTAFGVILEALDASPFAGNTLVIFTADHGIPFNRCKMSLYDRGLEVPFLMRGPGLPSGAQDHLHMISNIDVLPTLLDLIGLSHPPNLHGRSFAPLLKGQAYDPTHMIFAEMTYHTYYDPVRCVRTPKWKLIANFECAPEQMPSPDFQNNGKGYTETSIAMGLTGYHPPYELYDLEADPNELRNLADDEAFQDVLHELRLSLRNWMQQTGDPLLEGPVSQGAYRNRMQAFLQ